MHGSAPKVDCVLPSQRRRTAQVRPPDSPADQHGRSQRGYMSVRWLADQGCEVDRPVAARKSGMPRWVIVCLAEIWRMVSSFRSAAAMLVSIAAILPS
jgi:hypothetical protein